MLFKTILNQTLNYKYFVFGKVRFSKIIRGQPTIEIEIKPRKGNKAICSGCNHTGPGYDKLPERRFEHVPFWGFLVFFIYSMRRVDCPGCGIVVEKVPWVNGKHHMTKSYSWFLAMWARHLSWKEVAECYKTSWYQVFRSVEMAVRWGLSKRNLKNIGSIGVDEVLWHRGHKYLTLVYQIDNHCKRLLWVGKERTVKTLLRFFIWFGKERTKELKFICSDMWKPYLKVIKKKANLALHILDRYHIMAQINKAIDKVRAEEVRKLHDKGEEPTLKKSRWIFLKRPKNLTEKQDQKLADLLKQNLKTVKSYLLKEDFQRLWDYVSPVWAGKFIDQWTKKVMYSNIEPMKKIAKMIRKHKPLILNWFKAKKQISAATVEGLNNKLKLTFRKSYGFRTFEATETQLYHTLGGLPWPNFTHKFF